MVRRMLITRIADAYRKPGERDPVPEDDRNKFQQRKEDLTVKTWVMEKGNVSEDAMDWICMWGDQRLTTVTPPTRMYDYGPSEMHEVLVPWIQAVDGKDSAELDKLVVVGGAARTKLNGHGDLREPDGMFYEMASDKGKEDPTVVFEIACSQRYTAAREKIFWWLSEGRGRVRVGVLVKIEHAEEHLQNILVELWTIKGKANPGSLDATANYPSKVQEDEWLVSSSGGAVLRVGCARRHHVFGNGKPGPDADDAVVFPRGSLLRACSSAQRQEILLELTNQELLTAAKAAQHRMYHRMRKFDMSDPEQRRVDGVQLQDLVDSEAFDSLRGAKRRKVE